MRFFYSLLCYVLLPFALLRLLVLSFKNPAYRQRMTERLGYISNNASLQGCKLIWIHAVSVGEVQATRTLVKMLKDKFSDYEIVITTTTPGGYETVKRLYGDDLQHFFHPYDAPTIVHQFLQRLNPSLVLMMETELWPNLVHACKTRNIPVCLINGRMSERSANGYARFATLTRMMLNNFTALMVQSDADKKQLQGLGCDEQSISVTGSLKFDIACLDKESTSASEFRSRYLPQSFIWIAASTHEGEEEIVLDVHRELLTSIPDALLILVPRHPERATKIMSLVHSRKLSCTLRSGHNNEKITDAVFLLDTLGELQFFYQNCDVTFLGGSLVEHGGHNPLEPASLAKPVITGPFYFNFKTIMQSLLDKGGALQIRSKNELLDCLLQMNEDKQGRHQIATRAAAYVQENQGATEKTMNVLTKILTE